MHAPIEIKALSKSFGSQSVLKQLSWEIQPGSIVGLLGLTALAKPR